VKKKSGKTETKKAKQTGHSRLQSNKLGKGKELLGRLAPRRKKKNIT